MPDAKSLETSIVSQLCGLCEEILCKALAVGELEELAMAERRLRKYLVAEAWDIAKKANKWIVDEVGRQAKNNLTRKEADSIARKYVRFFKDYSKDVKPELEKVNEQAYLAGKKSIIYNAYNAGKPLYEPILKQQLLADISKAIKKPPTRTQANAILARVKPNFTLVDQRAVNQMVRQQVFWIGDYFDKRLSKHIAKVVKEIVIEQGLEPKEAERVLKETLEYYWDPKQPPKPITDFYIPSPPNMTPSEYWEGVAANAATVGRIQGAMRQMASININQYEVVEIEDERQCPICGEMNGMVLDVQTAVEHMDSLLGKSPSDVKAGHPWVTAKEFSRRIPPYSTRADGTKHIRSPGARTSFQKSGYGYPPYHLRCRGSIVIHSETQFEPIEMEPEIEEQLPKRNPPKLMRPKK